MVYLSHKPLKTYLALDRLSLTSHRSSANTLTIAYIQKKVKKSRLSLARYYKYLC